MGFPSPAADFVERRISFDEGFLAHPAATYYMRAEESYYRAGAGHRLIAQPLRRIIAYL